MVSIDVPLLKCSSVALANCGLSAYLRMWLFSKSDVGYALNSYLINSARSICTVLEMTRNFWKNKPESIRFPGAIVTANELLRNSDSSVLLKTKVYTCCPSILRTTSFLTD